MALATPLFLLSLSLPFLLASLHIPPSTANPSPTTPNHDRNHFDFIIIGGGTTGLALASRLSECPNVTVAVVEAGKDESNNPNVTSVSGFGGSLGFYTPIDWLYSTTNQSGAGGRRLDYHQGKAWGGTSAMNGMTYIRPSSTQITAWATSLGNDGWTWDNIWPYFLKSESFTTPTKAQLASGGASYIDAYHGRTGPVNVAYQYALQNGSFASIVNATWQSLVIPFNPDVNGGELRGFFVWPQTMDRDANVREDAARAYYLPIRERGNLVMLRGRVDRIFWADADSGSSSSRRTGGNVIAEGVQYTGPDGSVTRLYADKEVILSAGSVRSPAILELSGVGNPDILNPLNIPIKIPLRSVGENAIDQPNTFMAYTSNNNTNLTGWAPYVTYLTAEDIFGSETPSISSLVLSQIPTWAQRASTSSHNAVPAAAIEHLFRTQHDLIFNKAVPSIEILTTSLGGNLVGSAFFILLPFSRGSVHISSKDPGAYPAIDPGYFVVDWDLTLQKEIVRVVERFWAASPVNELVRERVQPSLQDVPADGNATAEQVERWIRGSFSPNHHLLGTAAMLPQDLGGVVDTELRVYGTANVRVVDASVLPTQVSGHLTSILYAVAERAADLVKGRWGLID